MALDRQDIRLKDVKPDSELLETIYVFHNWTTPLRESIGEEFFLALEVMKTLVPEGGSTKDVRIVFDFDS